ncbi:Uncharacterized [Moorella glycerini]|uniref:Uncharacterized protein n=1 Tax=Neomoorella stamsii TaxID=1266720 RepID=A0A9X7P539_9FIRM|nr:hypothetical protein MOST_30260 [Moorella stamsii]CEP67872.1 Uncharacterized [Moorella glycerini]CEP68742.1 Uncharacterized [Moorella glycerini]
MTHWSIQNDKLSVTVGINHRLWILRQQGMLPTLIRLGKEHTRLFWKERGLWYIPKGPRRIISGDVFWDEVNSRWCYSKRMIPLEFNDPLIYGIAIEGIPKPPKKKST